MGVVTDAFAVPEPSIGLPMAAAISVEPLWSMLIENDIYPASNGEFVRELQASAQQAKEGLDTAETTAEMPF